MSVLTPSRRSSKRATLADVAKRAGCSIALVSKVVNGSNSNCGASPSLTKKITEAVRELDYQPSFASQSLARQSTRTIGVYVPGAKAASFADTYEGELLRGVEQACQAHGFDWLAINFGGEAAPHACRERLAQRRIDGLLLLHVAHDVDWIAPLIQQGSRIAAVNFFGDVPGLFKVNFDGAAAVRLAVRHLLELGHRRIAYLGVLTDHGPGAWERAEAYRLAMGEAGQPVRSGMLIDHANPDLVSGHEIEGFEAGVERGMSSLFERSRDDWPTAVVCYSDYTALRLIGRCHDAGIDVPGDISIVGIDNTSTCELIRPRLTSVAQPLGAMGRRAALRLIDPAAVDAAPGFVPHLVVRGSSGPPRLAE